MRYAARTAVSPERSRLEIEQSLRRYKADEFAYATAPGRALIGFRFNGKSIRYTIPLPTKTDAGRTPTGRLRHGDDTRIAAAEQMERQRWRALALAIKAKLEFVESGITTFEEEFLAHVVMSNGKTIGEWAVPQLDRVVSGRLALQAGESSDGNPAL